MEPAKSISRGNVFTGALLILAGCMLLLNRFNILGFHSHELLWGLGAAAGFLLAIQGFAMSRRGRVFWGSMLFFVCLYASLVVWKLLPEDRDAWFPHVSIALALAFLILFLYEPRNIALLVPLTLFGGIGVIYYLWVTELVEMWEIKRVIRLYWPGLLILWGLALVFSRRKEKA